MLGRMPVLFLFWHENHLLNKTAILMQTAIFIDFVEELKDQTNATYWNKESIEGIKYTQKFK